MSANIRRLRLAFCDERVLNARGGRSRLCRIRSAHERMDSIEPMNVHIGLLAAVAALLVMRQAGEVAGCRD
ncbi:hypothetical protein PACILC2_39460 [Paenibacillus cisolokensis]|uniref:Uncharacterized protein n=1 Tax=Paenibacillus cisolokensis TaxID=1658519 RepID=A0ABQ4NAX5_9BACL|nr:hypothetical protein [Paenibacillus cisolokensis]GIQ65378.1 hypothetical protein PACILC2_39460 [Paenibacillus cisolokensis]